MTSPLLTPQHTISFNKPYLDEEVFGYLREVIESGKLSGDGAICKSVEGRISELFGITHVLLTTSCTHALEMAMMMLDLHPGDEVILPSFTFVSTANAILRAGGRPVFCEITDRTLTLDPADFERRITKRTRAVVPVHYAGVAAEMDEIISIARQNDIIVVEDAAQGVNARYKGRYLGGIGDAGAFSFHDTKNFISGEGGAFLTNGEAFARRAEIIREKGTNRANFLRGEIDKYTWVDQGSSFILSELLAALLKHQLTRIDEIQRRRSQIHWLYMEELRDLEEQEKFRLPVIPDHCESNYHIFYLLLPDERLRNRLLLRLKEVGVSATFHYVPLHSAPYARRVLATDGLELPVTDRVSGTLLRLPIYPQLPDEAVQIVTETIRAFMKTNA